MKTFVITILLLLPACFAANAQNFYVVKVEGKIFCDDKELKTGDKLNHESTIQFTEPENKIYLLSPSDGYFLLTPAEQDKTAKTWVVVLKSAIIPQNKYYKTATRGSGNNFSTFDDIYDLMGFFKDKVLIINGSDYYFNPEKIKLDENNYFEFINKNGSEKPQIVTSTNSFSFAGNLSEIPFELIYHLNGENKSIGKFLLTIKSRKEIADEMAVFFSSDIKKSTAVYYEQVLPYLAEVYGNTNLETIKNIIISDLKIPLEVKD